MRKIVYFDHTTGGKHRIDTLAEGFGVQRIQTFNRGIIGNEDICFVEGLEENAVRASREFNRVVLRLNAMELYKGGAIGNINWSNVKALFVHGEHLKDYFCDIHRKLPRDKVHSTGLIIDMGKFGMNNNFDYKKVAVNSEVHWRKGVQLIPEFLAKNDVHVYHIGQIVNHDAMNYVNWRCKELGVSDKYHYQGTTNDVREWLEGKGFIFHPSYTEGCPRAVGEAMSKGITPIVHNYRGAKVQFPNTFNDVDNIVLNTIKPNECRDWVKDNYSSNVVVNKFKKVLCSI